LINSQPIFVLLIKPETDFSIHTHTHTHRERERDSASCSNFLADDYKDQLPNQLDKKQPPSMAAKLYAEPPKCMLHVASPALLLALSVLFFLINLLPSAASETGPTMPKTTSPKSSPTTCRPTSRSRTKTARRQPLRTRSTTPAKK